MRRAFISGLMLLCCFWMAHGQPQDNTGLLALGEYLGDYEYSPGKFLSIARFDEIGKDAIIFTDFDTGRIGLLTIAARDFFTAGPGLLVNSPVEVEIRFIRNKEGVVTGLIYRERGAARTACKINLMSEAISFPSDGLTLSGTILVPARKGPHPAVILVHGSGETSRFSFGPYPYYFAAQGYAVLFYDKRGVGSSQGDWKNTSYFDFADDVRAGIDYLKRRSDIDRRRIGLWGSSQGGMIEPIVASRSRDVAFVIDISGNGVPLWQQELYYQDSKLRENGFTDEERAKALAITRLGLAYAQTGRGLTEFKAAAKKARSEKWFDYTWGNLADDEPFWQAFSKMVNYDPAIYWAKTRVPTLAIYGSLDNSSPIPQSPERIKEALKKGRNRDFTVKTFVKANHAMLDAESGGDSEIPRLERFAPSYLAFVEKWLKQRITVRGVNAKVSADCHH